MNEKRQIEGTASMCKKLMTEADTWALSRHALMVPRPCGQARLDAGVGRMWASCSTQLSTLFYHCFQSY